MNTSEGHSACLEVSIDFNNIITSSKPNAVSFFDSHRVDQPTRRMKRAVVVHDIDSGHYYQISIFVVCK